MRFSKKSFQVPPPELTPAYFWGINEKMRLPELKRQLHEMYASGCRSVCLHPFPNAWRVAVRPSHMSPEYLSKEYMLIIRALVRECKKLGMHYYLYDEGGYPSGGACGKVWETSRERFTRKCYYFKDGELSLLNINCTPSQAAPYPDLLAKGATETFIKLTHEAHKKYVADEFGKTVKFVFTDEPGMSNYTDGIFELFAKRFNYDIQPHLRAIFDRDNDHSEKAARMRVDYFELLSELFLARFVLPIRRWCRKNNLISGGHFNVEDTPAGNFYGGHGNIMQALRGMDLPGVDSIWRQIFSGMENPPFPKYAASAANQNGPGLALAEVFAVYGNGITPQQMKYLIDYMLVCGINVFVLSNFMQSYYEHWMSGCRPHYGPANPMWKYMPELHNYISRAGTLMSMGKSANDTAFYYDIRSIWAGGDFQKHAIEQHLEISAKLASMQCGFDFIDDTMLANARIKNGSLVIGKMRYRTLVMPESRWISAKAQQNISRFKEAGGTVLSPGELDRAPRLVKMDNPAVKVLKRVSGNKAVYFFMNDSDSPQKADICLPERQIVAQASFKDGKFYAYPAEEGKVTVEFAPFESKALTVGIQPDAPAMAAENQQHSVTLSGNWSFKPLKEYALGEDDYLTRKPANTAAVNCTLGSWAKYVGNDFSGDCVYTLEFTNPGTARSALLDLGKLSFAAKVKCNGIDCGQAFFPPHRLQIPLKAKQNRLEIIVTNTFANALNGTHAMELWQKYEKYLNYEKEQSRFEKESIDGGLYGPVVLYY